MKGHLELFQNRLLDQGSKLPGADKIDLQATFAAFEAALGGEIPYYDVQSGPTLADYYTSHFIAFAKAQIKKA